MLSVMMGTVVLAALAMLRTIGPLVSRWEDRTAMLRGRTRAAHEREKVLTLRSIKELEFDYAMKKLSDDDFREMSGRLRARASRLIRELDSAAGYRELIERDLVKRLGALSTDTSEIGTTESATGRGARAATRKACGTCSTWNETDARFCKGCGAPL
jgi:hypothetical protein